MDAIKFALSRIGEPHKHHRHCVHNLSAEEQKAAWRRRAEEAHPENPDAWYQIVYGDSEPVTITPDQWEIEVPDIEFDNLRRLLGVGEPVEGNG